jgi:hypothetical protein
MDDSRTCVNRAQLDEMIARTGQHAPHLTPVIEVVRDFGSRLLLVPQTTEAMTEALDVAERPFIAIVADDTDRAVGPDHFDRASLDRLIGMADGAAVVASAPRADVYDRLSALAALFARNILIVETRPEQEIGWIKAIQQAKADLPLIVCTVEATRQ